MLQSRLLFLVLFLACASLLGFGYYLQFIEGLEPCPLCIFQRVAYMVITALALVAAVHGPGMAWRRVYAALVFVAALAGGGIAARQVWLQHLPADRVPECGPGLDYMLDVLPLAEVVKSVFRGSGECAEVDWTFLSFSIAEWSLACFLVIAVAVPVLVLRRAAPGPRP